MQANTGKIRIGQQARATSYPTYPGFEIIPAWSRGKAPWKNLSPFYMGPVKFKYPNGQEDESPNVENYWQCHKCWEKVDKQSKDEWSHLAETHVEEFNEKSLNADCISVSVGTINTINKNLVPNEKWYHWHDKLIRHSKPVRRPNGKHVPLYAWWYNHDLGCYEKLNTIEARKKSIFRL